MKNIVKYYESVEASFRKTKVVAICAVVMATLVSLGSLVYAFTFVARHSDNVYVIDRGSAYFASVAGSEMIDRSIEAQDHVKRFHEYLFSLYPSREVIQRNIESALVMCDKSAYDYYLDQQERGFYTRLIQTNTSQYVSVDSVKVNMSSYPYQERTFARIFVLRESNITSYAFESEGQLIDVGRSKSNPHGLMLERFAVTRYEKLETRKRNQYSN